MPQAAVAAAPVIQTREQLEAVLENIAQLELARNELYREQENEIAAVRQRYRAPLAEMDSYLDLETGWVEAWANGHPEIFAENRSLACAHATVGFESLTPRLERASRRWTWTRIAQTLAELSWGKRYLRVPPPEVDKDAIVADLGHLTLDDLRAAGMRLVEGDRFFLTTNRDEPSVASSEPAWQQAA
jgi:phage host-nuclease inhibitor protein Gam